MKNGHEQQPDRRHRSLHHDWHLWKTAWDEAMAPIQKTLRAEKAWRKANKLKARGRYQNPRRVARMKACATILCLMRERVREIAREEAKVRTQPKRARPESQDAHP